MELFTEIYNCYYQIVSEICTAAQDKPISEKNMLALAARFGFEESGYRIVPKLIANWNLLEETKEGYLSKIDNPANIPLTTLQKSWLKSILTDKYIPLFLDPEQIDILNAYLKDIDALFAPEYFHYYDRFSDGDDCSSPAYVSHFRTLLQAIRDKRFVTIRFYSRKGDAVCHTYLPCRIEYSAKNDKFRLLAVIEKRGNIDQNNCNINKKIGKIETLNLSRIESLSLTDRFYPEVIDLQKALQDSYYKEPVKLLITTKRNTLERTMLHFANYEKQTRKIDETTYECDIYYNSMMETELLIEILSFGPTVKVLGPGDFLLKIKHRISRQQELLASRPHT